MKCKSCPLGEQYMLYLLPEHGGDVIEIIQCPFGTKAFHLGEARCVKFSKRKKTLQGGDENEE